MSAGGTGKQEALKKKQNQSICQNLNCEKTYICRQINVACKSRLVPSRVNGGRDFIRVLRAKVCFWRIRRWSDNLQMSLQSVVEWSINPSIKETIAMQCVIHPKILLANQTGRAQKTCSCKKFWVLRSELENGFLIRADSDREMVKFMVWAWWLVISSIGRAREIVTVWLNVDPASIAGEVSGKVVWE